MATRQRQRGCTLTEALVTLAILSFGIAGVAQLQLDLLRATGQGKTRTEALALAQAHIEQLRTITRPDPYGATSGSSLGLAGSNGRFDVHWTITPATGGARYAVQVSAHWTDAQGLNRQVWLDTLLPATDPAWAARTLD
ncbi:MAG: prepilin-type N-terminal cleavage/methylation domain-containing protein [Gammaproteobacteria bacterium]|nr:prepilin-type N-terminal cleavage/methylation domain-containing protein [Gammaproteobacteria bacterium]